MLKGFREFIARGNVIDLATAVIVGAAFTGLVTAFTDHIVQPLVSRIGATPNSDYGFLRIPLGNDVAIDLNAVKPSSTACFASSPNRFASLGSQQ